MRQNPALDAHQHQEQQRQADLGVVGDVADAAVGVTDVVHIVAESRSRAEVQADTGFTGGGADATLDDAADTADGIWSVFEAIPEFLGGLSL